jgi:hypothetical protein
MKKRTKLSATDPSSDKKNNENSEGIEEGFPGYPLYPAKEDIMNRAKRLDVDVNTAIESNQPLINAVPTPSDRIGTDPSNSDLTADDFQALASDEIESTGDDEILQNRPWPVDFAGEDLDVPGSEADDAQEMLGSEDEENNSYSIGSDRHEDLETDKS